MRGRIKAIEYVSENKNSKGHKEHSKKDCKHSHQNTFTANKVQLIESGLSLSILRMSKGS